MDPVTLITTAIAVAKGLSALAVDITPMIANIKAAIDGLLGKGHVTDAQAADLHAQTTALESQWADTLAAARAEGSGTVTS
jgi:hypothetical protein